MVWLGRIVLALALLTGPAWAEGITNPGGSSSITAGTTPITCTSGTTGVLFQSAGKVACDSGFTYAGAGGAVTLAPTGTFIGSQFSSPTNVFQVNAFSGSYQVLLNTDTGSYTLGALTDLWLSRSAAGVFQIGTTANNSLGSILAANYRPGIVYSAAGTALPTCNAGFNGVTAVVSDSTAPTYRNVYTSGGAVTARVLCVNGTGWVND
jgi:hypothetical protein